MVCSYHSLMKAVCWISLNKNADGCLFVHAAPWLLHHCVVGAGLRLFRARWGVFESSRTWSAMGQNKQKDQAKCSR